MSLFTPSPSFDQGRLVKGARLWPMRYYSIYVVRRRKNFEREDARPLKICPLINRPLNCILSLFFIMFSKIYLILPRKTDRSHGVNSVYFWYLDSSFKILNCCFLRLFYYEEVIGCSYVMRVKIKFDAFPNPCLFCQFSAMASSCDLLRLPQLDKRLWYVLDQPEIWRVHNLLIPDCLFCFYPI